MEKTKHLILSVALRTPFKATFCKLCTELRMVILMEKVKQVTLEVFEYVDDGCWSMDQKPSIDIAVGMAAGHVQQFSIYPIQCFFLSLPKFYFLFHFFETNDIIAET